MSKEDLEKKMFLKYVLTTYREQLQLAKTENKPSKISIDYPLLNEYFKKETGKEFLTAGFELFLKYTIIKQEISGSEKGNDNEHRKK